jgi:hypothetical protein
MTYKELLHLLSLMDDQELDQEIHLQEQESGEVIGVWGLRKSYEPKLLSNIPTVTLAGTKICPNSDS